MATLCMSTYLNDLCIVPGGMTKISDITNSTTDVHGWILRDDGAREILAVFRGTESLQNYATDTNYTLAPFDIFPQCEGCEVHGGYYLAWVSIVEQVQARLQEQKALFPDYGVVLTGHSLGGSLAALAAAQFSPLFDNITVYTMGEPRTGNAAFASFIDQRYSTSSPETTRFYRCTHADDGIPNAPPTSDGYVHHGLEYWNLDPTSAENTYVCTEDGAVQCCEAQNGSGINAAHLVYFGRPVVVGGQCL
ncbi:hypothetical protein VTN96DRAFT_5080 [Rasamsonia emersonii]